MRKIAVLFAAVAIIAFQGFAVPAQADSRARGEQIMQAGYDVGSGGTLRVDVPDADIEVLPGSGKSMLWKYLKHVWKGSERLLNLSFSVFIIIIILSG